MTSNLTVERPPAKSEQPAPPRSKPHLYWSGPARYAVLLVGVVISLFPVVLIVSTAFRDPIEVQVDPFSLFTSFSLDSVRLAWNEGGFSRYFWNSILLTVPSTMLTVVLSCGAGYAFARCRFWGRDFLFYVCTLGMLVPFFTIMIPLYYQLLQMKLLDNWVGAILVMSSTGAGGVAFGTFLMRSFFLDIPPELEEAARIDGCSEWKIFTRIMLPLVKSGAAALTVFVFLQAWNNFLVPLLYLPGEEHRTLAPALYLFSGGRTMELGAIAAGVLITIIPVVVLFLVAQRQLIRGLMSGAVKG